MANYDTTPIVPFVVLEGGSGLTVAAAISDRAPASGYTVPSNNSVVVVRKFALAASLKITLSADSILRIL